jgi:hypothetical protein
MADIEERALKAWAEFEPDACVATDRDIFIAGYLAGAAQAQRDYVAHYEGRWS